MKNKVVEMYSQARLCAQSTNAQNELADIIIESTKLVAVAWGRLSHMPILNVHLRKIIEDAPQLRKEAIIRLLKQHPDLNDLECILEHSEDNAYVEIAADAVLRKRNVDAEVLEWVIDCEGRIPMRSITLAKKRLAKIQS